MATCAKCLSEITDEDNHTAVKCGTCNKYYHFFCAINGATLIRNINQLRIDVNAIKRDLRAGDELFPPERSTNLEAQVAILDKRLADLESLKDFIAVVQLGLDALTEN